MEKVRGEICARKLLEEKERKRGESRVEMKMTGVIVISVMKDRMWRRWFIGRRYSLDVASLRLRVDLVDRLVALLVKVDGFLGFLRLLVVAAVAVAVAVAVVDVDVDAFDVDASSPPSPALASPSASNNATPSSLDWGASLPVSESWE